MSQTYYVIFGTSILPNGIPDLLLKGRVEAALEAGRDDPSGVFVLSGGAGKYGPTEAEVMADLLSKAGIPAARMRQDRTSLDTFENVINVSRLIRAESTEPFQVVVCTSNFHMPRCRLLFYLIGIPTVACPANPVWPRFRRVSLLFFCLREIPATAWDAFLMLLYHVRS